MFTKSEFADTYLLWIFTEIYGRNPQITCMDLLWIKSTVWLLFPVDFFSCEREIEKTSLHVFQWNWKFYLGLKSMHKWP